MANYHRGKAAEYHCINELQQEGYEHIRAAASKGVADVVVWNEEHTRFIQIKREKLPSNNTFSALRREIAKLPCPPGARYELWVWTDFLGWRLKMIVLGEEDVQFLHRLEIPPKKRGRKPKAEGAPQPTRQKKPGVLKKPTQRRSAFSV